jgi:hypothetical protein
MSWRVYDEVSDRIASALMSTDLARGECVIVFMADGPLVHAAFVGAEKAGLIVMGIGHRAGEAELNHLVGKSHAEGIVTLATHRDEASTALVARLREKHPALEHHIVIDGPSTAAAIAVMGGTTAHTRDPGLKRRIDARRVGASDCTSSIRRRAPPGCPSASCRTRIGGSSSTRSRSTTAVSAPTNRGCPSFPRRSGSGCGPRTSPHADRRSLRGHEPLQRRRHDPARRAGEGHRAVLRVDAIHHDVELAGAR